MRDGRLIIILIVTYNIRMHWSDIFTLSVYADIFSRINYFPRRTPLYTRLFRNDWTLFFFFACFYIRGKIEREYLPKFRASVSHEIPITKNFVSSIGRCSTMLNYFETESKNLQVVRVNKDDPSLTEGSRLGQIVGSIGAGCCICFPVYTILPRSASLFSFSRSPQNVCTYILLAGVTLLPYFPLYLIMYCYIFQNSFEKILKLSNFS